MYKSFYSLLFAIVLISFVSANVSAITNIAYIVNDPDNPNIGIVDILDDSDYSFDIIDDSEVPFIDFDNYNMVLVWDGLLQNYDEIPITEKNSMVGNLNYLEDWKIAKDVQSRTVNGYERGRIATSNRITEGFSSPIQLYDSRNIQFYYLSSNVNERARGLVNVIAKDSSDMNPVISIIPRNAALISGTSLGRIGVITAVSTEYWTNDMKTLFIRTIDWIMEGEDKDGDGFLTDQDCDDFDALSYPGAEEIPYDGIDQDCDGEDYNDLDEDGFIAVEANGDDCDDNDETINPDAPELDKNCLNDKPQIDEVGNLVIRETETLVVILNGTDPDNDNLIYDIDDDRFIQDLLDKNIFRWETGFDDKGNYIFSASVSDGELSDSVDLGVEVRDNNREPSCEIVPEINWDEDTTTEINLNDYCSDPDNDILEYYVMNSSDNEFITLDSIIDGIVTLSAINNWFGEDFIQFFVSDGLDDTLTNEIVLTVNPIDDSPVLIKDIEDIEFQEDSEHIIHILDYYNEPDNELLSCGAIGNDKIQVLFNNDDIILNPLKDWFGEETIRFYCSDGTTETESNEVKVLVIDANEAPVFGVIDCNTSIDEDTMYDCLITASDFEDDDLSYSVSEVDNMQCYFEENTSILKYQSSEDFNGSASCTIKVEDMHDYDEEIIVFNINNINDGPKILGTSPESPVKVLSGEEVEFSVESVDPDSEQSIYWVLDGLEVDDNVERFNFNETERKMYELIVLVTDDEYIDSFSWNIFVGGYNDFTCSEVDSYTCTKDEICTEGYLDVKDTDVCCPIACVKRPPEFSDIDEICELEEINSSVLINIIDPNSNDEFSVGDNMSVSVDIENRFSEDLDFDVYFYLYDEDSEEILADYEDTVNINENDKERFDIEFVIPDEVDTDDEIYLYVSAFSEDSECNNRYRKIDILRPTSKVIISETNILGNELSCIDYLDLEVKLENLGSQDKDVYVVVENKELGISEKSETFEIENYEDNNRETKHFSIKLPEVNVTKEYEFDIFAYYSSTYDSASENVEIRGCETEIVNGLEIQDSEPIVLNYIKEDTSEENIDEADPGFYNSSLVTVLIISALIFFIGLILVVYAMVFKP